MRRKVGAKTAVITSGFLLTIAQLKYKLSPMNSVMVFLIQVGLSFAVLFLMVRWFVGPYLAAQPVRKVMLLLLAPHVAHHAGLAVLVFGVVGAGFPRNFAVIIALGDSLMLFLVMLCMGTVRSSSVRAPLCLWVFTAAGFGNYILSSYVGIPLISTLVNNFQAHWYVSVFYVPVLATSHILVLMNLIKRGHELRAASTLGKTAAA